MKRFAFNWFCWVLVAGLLTACNSESRAGLDTNSQLALEVGIVSLLASHNSIFPVDMSDHLKQRLQSINGIHRRALALGTMTAGRIKSVPGGGPVLRSGISDPKSASIEVWNGEVGLKNGDIFVGDGTQLIDADGKRFMFVRGAWQEQTEPPQGDTITVITLKSKRSEAKALGLSDDEMTPVLIAAAALHAAHKAAPGDVQALIEKMKALPVKTASGRRELHFEDIASIELLVIANNTDGNKNILRFGFGK